MPVKNGGQISKTNRPAGQIGSALATPQAIPAKKSFQTKPSDIEQEILLSKERAFLAGKDNRKINYQKSQTESFRPINENFLSAVSRKPATDGSLENDQTPNEDEINESAILADQAIDRLGFQPETEIEETDETDGNEEEYSADDSETENASSDNSNDISEVSDENSETDQETALSEQKSQSAAALKPNLNQLSEAGGEAAKELVKKQIKKKIWLWLLSALASISPYLAIALLFLLICFPIIMAYQCWEQKGTAGLAASSLWNGFEKTLTDAITGQCITDTSAKPKTPDTSETPAASAAATETKDASN